MNRCLYQQRNAMGGCEEERVFGSLVCPKPRRFGAFNQARPGFHNSFNYQLDIRESDAESELLDMILSEDVVSSSPPFYAGSPPSRATNPVIQDARFSAAPPPSPRAVTGKCARMKFGHKPAAVRIEGFDCHGDCGSRSVSAVA